MAIGRQPLTGLTLFFFQSSICFCMYFCWSSLYFSLSTANSGASACIRFIERVLAAVNGQNKTLMITVINTIASP